MINELKRTMKGTAVAWHTILTAGSWEESRNPATIASIPAEIRTKHILDKTLEHYCYVTHGVRFHMNMKKVENSLIYWDTTGFFKYSYSGSAITDNEIFNRYPQQSLWKKWQQKHHVTWSRFILENNAVVQVFREFSTFFWNPKIYYHAHMRPWLVPILIQTNPVYTLTSDFSRINVNTFTNFCLVLSSYLFPSDFSTKILHAFILFSNARYMSGPSHLPHNIRQGVEIKSSWLWNFLHLQITSSQAQIFTSIPCSHILPVYVLHLPQYSCFQTSYTGTPLA
jgi:hypothetical protein